MLIKKVPETVGEVIIGRRSYSIDTKRLSIPYRVNGQEYNCEFTEEETNKWNDDDAMIDLLCEKEGLVVVEEEVIETIIEEPTESVVEVTQTDE